MINAFGWFSPRVSRFGFFFLFGVHNKAAFPDEDDDDEEDDDDVAMGGVGSLSFLRRFC